MFVLAVTWAEALPAILGILGLSSIIFSALRYRRDDTTAVLGQQNTILTEMKTLNDELRDTTGRLREERDLLKTQVQDLTDQIEELRTKLQQIDERRN